MEQRLANEEFFKVVKEYHEKEKLPDVCAQHHHLLPKLRPYQEEAVKWMVYRETHPIMEDGNLPYIVQKETASTSTTDCSLHVDRMPTGGILCDEMGLGKTVEVLSCILVNPRVDIDLPQKKTGKQSRRKKFALDEHETDDEEWSPAQTESAIGRRKQITRGASRRARTSEATMENSVPRRAEEVLELSRHDENLVPPEPVEKSVLSTKETEEMVPKKEIEDLQNEFTHGLAVDSLVPKEEVEEGHTDSVCDLDVMARSGEVDESADHTQIAAVASGAHQLKRSTGTGKKASRRKVTWEDESSDLEGVPQKKKKAVSRVRSEAQAWYESKLSEVRHNPIRVYRESWVDSPSSTTEVQCICDDEFGRRGLIKCNSCSRLLHEKCIGASEWKGIKPINCPQCWLKQEIHVPSRATLIVSPRSISRQWLNEAKNHISPKANFKVLFYRGVKVDGYLQPYAYSDYDLILTTYDILRQELYLSEVHEGRSRRYERRYYSPTCPLICVGFWRICLDEAQMVEGPTRAAEMVSRLVSVHRWAVTGTPIQKSFQDLYGLVLFLCVEPYCNAKFWKSAIYDPYCDGDKIPLYTLLAQILWRSSKADVLDQISIPPQSELIWWLNFSPIEEHFYLRTHQECSNDFLHKLSKFESLDISLSSLRLTTVNSVLTPLLKLRQACSTPHAVRGNIFCSQKRTLTMPELLESLIQKTTLEAQDALRKHIASLNGLAGLHIICHEYASAAEKYREVLRITEEYKDRVKVDTLQKIHTLSNLAEIIQAHRDIIPPTLRDDKLLEESKQQEESYLKKAQTSVKTTSAALSELTETVYKFKYEMDEDESNWWFTLLTTMDRDEILNKVHEALVNHRKSIPDVSATSIINKVSTIQGIKLTCNLWLESLEKNEKEVRKSLKKLMNADDKTLVAHAVDCHLRISSLKSKVGKAQCELCACEDSLKKYEMDLFDIKLKKNENIMVGDVMLLGQGKEGSWKRSEQEAVLKTLLTYGRQKREDKSVLKSGSKFFSLMDALRKEFKSLRLLWSRINEQTQARDELNMCKLRLRVCLPDEAAPSTAHVNKRKRVTSQLSSNLDTKMENLHIIEKHQVEVMAQQNKAEAALALSEVRKKSGTMVYLQNLRTTDENSKSTMEVCPVCRCDLEKKWAVLSCGHCYCMLCIPELFKKKRVLCAVCRETTHINEVSFVNASQEYESADADDAGTSSGLVVPSVQGSYSTKVDAVVRRLFHLRATDPSVKVLIFSTWDRVLDVLKEALDQNNVSSLRLKPGTYYESTLQAFKDTEKEDPVTALLLLLKLGSKGLNLTEATHVMLVEPLLNPAEELQAIGRVHRIGQTRPTFVHRFLIKESIEDKMFAAVKATGKDQWSQSQVTLGQLKNLFTMSSSVETEVETVEVS